MECNRASVYHRHAKQCGTTYISKGARRPGTRITGFRKILRFVAFIAFPAMFGLSTVTRELILITVGENGQAVFL